MKKPKHISVLASEVPSYVSQNGIIYEGKEYNLVKFGARCESGFWGYLTDKNGIKITRGRKLGVDSHGTKFRTKFGIIIFERI